MAQKPIHWTNVVTLASVAILVGAELVGASWAAAWALGGLFQLSPVVSRSLEILFILIACAGLFFFMRAAFRVEPVRG